MKIELTYDPQTQGVTVTHDKDFKTMDMVIAVLDMAKSTMEFNRHLARMQQAAVAQQQAMQDAAIRQQLSR